MKKPYIKSLIILATLIIVCVISIIVTIYITSHKKISILVAPVSATITINGKNYTNGTYNLPTGEVTATIQKDGFITKKITINTSETTNIHTYLLQSDGTYTWYLEHPEDATILTTIGGEEAKLLSNDYQNKYPIMQNLPIIFAEYDKEYNYTEYRIDGGSFPDCPIDFCIKITDTTGGNYQPAINKLKSLDQDIEKYHILYEHKPIIPL